jgi:cytochrome oxidase Cu insertion factor (SCO1/SenC/PrrC family)
MSRIGCVAVVAGAFLAGSTSLFAQGEGRVPDHEFPAQKPAVGDLLPEAVLYAPDGTPVKTATLRGHWTVLTFGCLT